jgi:DNA (cytosine-5)-methyltransferase 1
MPIKKQKGRRKKIQRTLHAIDLFCGCGGLTQGLKKAGFRVIWAVDNDSSAVAAYRANHKEVDVREADIRTLDYETIKRQLKLKKGALDLLAGCPPCQGFSTLRTANGYYDVYDERNDLLHQFYIFAKTFLPRAVMLENVPGLAETHRFKLFIARMRKLGYVGEFEVLDAADYGVPQRRRRLIYIGGRRFTASLAEPSKRLKSVRDTIARLPLAGRSGDPLHDFPENRSKRVSDLIKKIPKNGGSRTELPDNYVLECHKEHDGYYDVYGRMHWDEVSPTITSGCFNPSKGRFLHPTQNRAITMREAALLQGFPRWYRFPTTRGKLAIALMIGNALPPPFIAAHARAIRNHIFAELRKIRLSKHLQSKRKK